MSQDNDNKPVETQKPLTPIVLRYLLSFVIVVLIAGIGALIIFGGQEMRKIADETNLLARKAKASEDNISQMKLLEKRYDEVKAIQPIIDKMVASQELYRYQNNALEVLYRYADLAGLTIAQANFNVGRANSSSKTGSTAKSTIMTINIKSPTTYDSFIKFMRLIEGGLSQMQILQVDVRKDKDNKISLGQMVIALYVK